MVTAAIADKQDVQIIKNEWLFENRNENKSPAELNKQMRRNSSPHIFSGKASGPLKPR